MDRRRLISKLEKKTGNPVVVVAAAWRTDIATDLDDAASRVVAEVLDGLDADRVTLVYGARGGEVGFADAVARSLRARGIAFDLVVPTLITGAGGLLALAAARVLVHPHGGVGAYDAGPLRNKHARLGPHLFDDVPALGGIQYAHDLLLPARLASGMRERRLARELARRLSPEKVDFDVLSHVYLGQDLGLDATQLAAAGFDAATFDEPALWALWRHIEDELGTLESAEPPYTEADLGSEVEFAPALGLLSAIVETGKRSFRFELDTGSPDPDTGIFAGAWSW